MQLAPLRYFNEVSRCGSIRRAAERLNVASSAISRQILKLEQEVGAPLFERRPRGMALTSAGEIYARYARGAVLDQERVRSELDDLRGLRRGHVRVHSVEGIVADSLCGAIVGFGARYPKVTFDLTVTGTDNVLAAVRQGETDLGIAFNAAPQEAVRFAVRLRDPLCAIAAPEHELARRARIGLVEALGWPVAVPGPSFGIRHLIDASCHAAGVRLRPALETNSIEALRSFARAGGGVSFLTRLSSYRDLSAGTLVAVPLNDRLPNRASMDFCVLAGRRLPAAVSEFLAFLQHSCEERRRALPPRRRG